MFNISIQLQGYLDKLKGPEFERTIPYMYIDTAGKVTVGVGHNITAKNDLSSLKFHVARLTRKAVIGGDVGIPIGAPQIVGRDAIAPEPKNDYAFLTKHPGLGKFGPEQLAAYTTLEMKDDDITDVFKKDLQDAIAMARSTFSAAFDSYPVSCQAALIDIAFNCGSFSTFHTLKSVIKGEGEYAKKTMSERWTLAAAHCKRGQVSSTRNNQVSSWFTQGASPAPGK